MSDIFERFLKDDNEKSDFQYAKEMEVSKRLAKLLAMENIRVIYAKVKTASFYSDTRVLVLPYWKHVSVTTRNLLVAHEVGHALFSEPNPRNGFREIFYYSLNVVDDARIEMKMKEQYPGTKKDFYDGYIEMTEDGFFGHNIGDSINSRTIIDKINVFFKANHVPGIDVKFSDEEMEFVDAIYALQTWDATIELAIQICEEFYHSPYATKEGSLDLFDFIPHEVKENFEESQDSVEESGEEVETEEEEIESQDPTEIEEVVEESAEEFEDDILDQDDATIAAMIDIEDMEASATTSEIEEKFEDELDEDVELLVKEESGDPDLVTINAMNDELEKKIDPNVPEFLYLPHMMPELIRPTSEFLKVFENEGFFESKDYQDFIGDLMDMNAENATQVRNLINEFEMRKESKSMSGSTISRKGSIDPNRLHMYNITDDIFKIGMESVETETNHRMVMLVDGSGSMQNRWKPTMKQLFALIDFCKACGISFDVFVFLKPNMDNSLYIKGSVSDANSCNDRYFHFVNNRFSLFNVLNSELSDSDLNKAKCCLMEVPYSYMMLGNTPLIESLLALNDYINSIETDEKINFITLTDGGDNTNIGYLMMDENNYMETRYFSYGTEAYVYDWNGNAALIKDCISPRNTLITMVLNQIREKAHSVIGYYLYESYSGTKKELRERFVREIRNTFGDDQSEGLVYWDNMLNHGVCNINFPGYDGLFAVNSGFKTKKVHGANTLGQMKQNFQANLKKKAIEVKVARELILKIA